jgi:hypothetical protein
MSKFFPFLDITRHQKFSPIVAYQTFIVKPCYNCFMGRNHFSRAGGPYFINDGFSKHDHSHEDPNHNELDKGLALYIAIGFLSLLAIISIVLVVL